MNYGAIGAVIGHEITPRLRRPGPQVRRDGTLRDWWTPEDAARVRGAGREARRAVRRLRVRVPGMHINGELTMGENIADLGGLLHRARRLSRLAARQAGAGDRRLDRRPARVPRLGPGLARQDARRCAAGADRVGAPARPPRQFRVIGPTRNADIWYRSFDVAPGERVLPQAGRAGRTW